MKSLVALAAAAALCVSSVAMSADSIVHAAGGGAWTAAQAESMYKPYERKTGVKVVSVDRLGGLADIAAQVKTGNIKWDVVELYNAAEAVKGCEEGLFETIDAGKLPAGADGTSAAKDFLPGTITTCAVGNVMFADIIAYDRSKLGANGPKTLDDFFNTKKFPGKRGLYKRYSPALEWALITDGVPMADVYTVLGTQAGVDRAFRKLDTIKKDIIWWEAGTQPAQLLASGEAVMTHSWNGRITDAYLKEKKDFAIMWDGQAYAAGFMGILKGSKNAAIAQDYLRFASGTQPLADLVNHIAYSPVRKSSMSKISDSNPNKVWLPGPHQPGRSFVVNTEFLADHDDDLNKRFNAWLAK